MGPRSEDSEPNFPQPLLAVQVRGAFLHLQSIGCPELSCKGSGDAIDQETFLSVSERCSRADGCFGGVQVPLRVRSSQSGHAGVFFLSVRQPAEVVLAEDQALRLLSVSSTSFDMSLISPRAD